MDVPALSLEEMQAIVSKITFLAPMRMCLEIHGPDRWTHRPTRLSVMLWTVDRDTQRTEYADVYVEPVRRGPILERDVPIRFIRDKNALINWVRGVAMEIWTHEFDEWFRYDGELVRDPHDPRREM